MREKLAFAAVAAVGVVFGGAVAAHVVPRPSAIARWTPEEARALDLAVQDVEARLHVQRARVSFWSELRDRHAQVSAVACANLGEHAVALQEREARAKVARGRDLEKRRLASAELPAE